VVDTNEFFQSINLTLLALDLFLLFLDRVDENDTDAVVFDAFDLTVFVVCNEKRIDLFNKWICAPWSTSSNGRRAINQERKLT
jgi:hypothetical protein